MIHQRGFTIVELLIAIVVIAILVSVSVVAYNGIQARAHNTAVQADINTLGKALALYHSRHHRYPTSTSDLRSLEASINRGSYSTDLSNLVYHTSTNGSKFFLSATSRGKQIYYTSDSNESVGETTGNSYRYGGHTYPNVGALVAAQGITRAFVGYDAANQHWSDWTNG